MKCFVIDLKLDVLKLQEVKWQHFDPKLAKPRGNKWAKTAPFGRTVYQHIRRLLDR